LEAKLPGTDSAITQHPHDELGRGAVVESGDGNIGSGEEAVWDGPRQKEKIRRLGGSLRVRL
jgi:hypothetical protein